TAKAGTAGYPCATILTLRATHLGGVASAVSVMAFREFGGASSASGSKTKDGWKIIVGIVGRALVPWTTAILRIRIYDLAISVFCSHFRNLSISSVRVFFCSEQATISAHIPVFYDPAFRVEDGVRCYTCIGRVRSDNPMLGI